MDKMEQPAEAGSATMRKFKDSEELAKAYRELEAEFTRRAQEASRLAEENRRLKGEDESEQAAEEFLKEFPEAEAYLEEIGAALEADDSLQGREGLQKAYMTALRTCARKPGELAGDESFLNEFIYGNQTVREKIIREYLDGLKESPVKDMGTGKLPVAVHGRPSTVRAAGELARALFRK